jgi:HEPN domain-containing protein
MALLGQKETYATASRRASRCYVVRYGKEIPDRMHEDVAYWLQLAALDLESARRSLRGESYLHCLFGCQQALEKQLKGLVVKATGQVPPRIHNLVRLAIMAQLSLSPAQEQLLAKLSLEYIEMRYPEELEALVEANTRTVAEDHLKETEALFTWLEMQAK